MDGIIFADQKSAEVVVAAALLLELYYCPAIQGIMTLVGSENECLADVR